MYIMVFELINMGVWITKNIYKLPKEAINNFVKDMNLLLVSVCEPKKVC